MDAFLGEIRLFAGTFSPVGWQFCDGSLLNIQQNAALYSLLGLEWGGDGKTTFALPNLIQRVPVGQGTGKGLTPRILAQVGGADQVTLAEANLPSHSHALYASSQPAGTATVAADVGLATPKVLASGKVVRYASPTTPPSALLMDPGSISTVTGASQPYDNKMPFLDVLYIICVSGIYPDKL